MAWNITVPADTAKIRDLGVLIRPNWSAIQEADLTFKPKAINLNDRTISGPSANPTPIADSYIIYSKSVSSGNSQLYGIDEAGNILQMTNGLPTLTTAGSSFIPGGLIIKWGTVDLSNVANPVTYPVAFPTATLAVSLTMADFDNEGVQNYAFRANAYTNTGFNAYFAYNGIRSFKYIALGY